MLPITVILNRALAEREKGRLVFLTFDGLVRIFPEIKGIYF